MDRRIATRAIIIRDNELFSVRQKHSDGSINDFWCTPGGGLDPGEVLKDGLTREMIEETGIAPVIGNLLFIQQFTERNGQEQLEFFFHVTNSEDYENIDLTKTSHGELELVEFGFIDPKKHKILPEFLANIDPVNLPQATQVFSYPAA